MSLASPIFLLTCTLLRIPTLQLSENSLLKHKDFEIQDGKIIPVSVQKYV